MQYNSNMMGKAIDIAGTEGKPLDDVFQQLLKDEYSRNFTKSGDILNPDLLDAAKEVTMQTELQGWLRASET